MNNEEKYKLAIERARQILKTPYTAGWDKMKELIEHLFPELVEDEDEKIKKMIIEIVKRDEERIGKNAHLKKIQWLEKQGEQKPVEWGEYGERMVARLRSIVNECALKNGALDVNGDYYEGDYGAIDSWLKSLRPQKQWKPSEEQLNALVSKLPLIKGSGDRAQTILESLYEQLKAL